MTTAIENESNQWILPQWPAPSRVHACVTTRVGGVSNASYAAMNLADHVNDDSEAVLENRRLLKQRLDLPGEPAWLQQTHSTEVIKIDARQHYDPNADGSYTWDTNVVCAVLTADCLPLLLCDVHGQGVAAVHAGWRGLANGIIEQTVEKMGVIAGDLLVWLGPAIGPERFEVGADVLNAFCDNNPQAEKAFTKTAEDRWLADLYHLAKLRLGTLGVTKIYGGDYCTYNDEALFYSYRRDKTTGRMASLIWLSD
ncbi:peptidoglycan editing factor PgeF [Kaarinaea lacus]